MNGWRLVGLLSFLLMAMSLWLLADHAGDIEGIRLVETSIDKGKTWKPAGFMGDTAPAAWRTWATEFEIKSPARVTVILDADMMRHERLNFHPLENTATTNIAREDLVRFIRACGHEPRITAVAGTR